MKIYINNQLVKTEILPAFTPTKDETLETFSFALISNKTPLPYAPMQLVKVDFTGDNTDVAYFYIVSDSVETYSLNPLRYKHSISCIQNTRKLSKHLVRNSVFTQPPYLTKSSFNAESQFVGGYISGAAFTQGNSDIPSLNWASEKLTLDSNITLARERIKKAYLKISFQYIQDNKFVGTTVDTEEFIISDVHTAQDLLDNLPPVQSITIASSLTLKYVNSANVTQTRTITPADFGETAFDLNKTYEFPLIKELSDAGAKEFEILFTDLKFIDGQFKTNYSTPITDNPNLYPHINFYMVQVEIVAETYYYTAFDILQLLQIRQIKQTTLGYDSKLFELPASGELYDLLNKTIAPDFIFTQLTMYECVAEVFRLFDAIFTMDGNGCLGIDYFNDLDTEVKSPKLTGRTLALGEDKYTNALVSNYQDGRVIETFPKSDFAGLRSLEFGVPEAQDHNFIVPHNIQSVIKCEVYTSHLVYAGSGGNPGWSATGDFPIDITRQVVEQSIWSSLDKGVIDAASWQNRTLKQGNTIYYEEGSNCLKVAMNFKNSWGVTDVFCLYNATQMSLIRMAGIKSSSIIVTDTLTQQTWGAVRMRLTYIASIDGKTKIHSLTNKYEGETLIDQANGAVDLNKLGLNMLGLSLKLGNPTLNATHKITSWDKRIKTGQIYNYQSGIWVANVVNYTFLNGMLQGKISFVQNFNQLSLRTQLLREKRMSNISRQLIQKSEEIITDFVYYSSSPTSVIGENIHFNQTYFAQLLYDSFKITGYYNRIGDAVLKNPLTNAIYIPLVTYGAGNTINFEMSFEHPMNAGNQTKAIESGWLFDPNAFKYFTSHVIYSADNGFLNNAYIYFPVAKVVTDTNFPVVTTDITTNYITIAQYRVYKQPNEIFALNYQLAFLPLPGRENTDFIGSEFINNNCFVKDNTNLKSKKIYLCIWNDGTKMSILDTKSSNPNIKKEITNVTKTETGNATSIHLYYDDVATSLTDYSWAIVDEEDNILFASNDSVRIGTDRIHLYFTTRRTRLI